MKIQSHPAVDAQDKIIGYRNWLGLMKKDLVAEFEKGWKKINQKTQSQ